MCLRPVAAQLLLLSMRQQTQPCSSTHQWICCCRCHPPHNRLRPVAAQMSTCVLGLAVGARPKAAGGERHNLNVLVLAHLQQHMTRVYVCLAEDGWPYVNVRRLYDQQTTGSSDVHMQKDAQQKHHCQYCPATTAWMCSCQTPAVNLPPPPSKASPGNEAGKVTITPVMLALYDLWWSGVVASRWAGPGLAACVCPVAPAG
jgi:hypothetical protein